jgi:hypothetical protein
MSGSAVVRWTIRVLGVALVVALAVLLVLRVYWSRRLAVAERDLRTQLGPLVASALESPKVPDDQNAAVFLRAGAEALILLGDDKPLVGDMSTTRPESWTESQCADLRRIVAANAPALELLHRAVGLEKSNLGLADSAAKMEKPAPVPLLFKALWVQRLLYDDAFLALKEHNVRRGLANAEVMSAMAAALEREPLLVAELVGIGCEKMLLGVVAGATASPDLDRAGISPLERTVVGVDLRDAWKRSLAQVALTRLGSAASPGCGGVRKILCSILPRRYDALAVEYCLRLVNAIDMPYGTELGDVAIAVPFNTPDLVRAAARNQVVLSQRRLARIALALRRQALETGTYPTALNAFPEVSEKDPFTGGRIVYTRRLDGSAQVNVPEGVKLWDEANPEVHNPGPFTWELPPPGPATGRDPKR